jgi:hypothetical protein
METKVRHSTSPGSSPGWTPEVATPPKSFSEIDHHPLARDSARLPTPPIKAAFDIISTVITQRNPGCSFVAHPRFGKSSAIAVLKEQVKLTYPDTPVIVVNAIGHARFSELTFYTEILEDCNHGSPEAGKVSARRIRLLHYLWSLAQAADSDRLVLFIDEAQNWAEPQLSTLRDLSNWLLEKKVRMIAILFGQTELAAIRLVLLQSRRSDIVGRFMLQQYEFFGVRSVSELVDIMKAYDDPAISEYPIGSGISYSEFFLPQAYRNGWRLEKEAGRLWEQYRLVAQGHGGLTQIGMFWITSCIRNFLLTQTDFDHPGLQGDDKDWEDAVDASAYAQSLGVIYDPRALLPIYEPAKAKKHGL